MRLIDTLEKFTPRELQRDNWIYYIFDGAKSKIYENQTLFRKEIYPNICRMDYVLEYTFKKDYFKGDIDKFYKKDFNHFDSKELYDSYLSLYQWLKDNNYKVDKFHQLQGLYGPTTVYMYVREENCCFIGPNFPMDDLLNLLSIKDLKIYVINVFLSKCNVFEYKLSIILSHITINEKIQEILNVEFRTRQDNLNIVKEKIQAINNINYKINPLNLKDKEAVLKLNKSFNDDMNRFMGIVLSHIKINDLIRHIETYNESMITLCKYSKEFSFFSDIAKLYVEVEKESFAKNINEYKRRVIHANFSKIESLEQKLIKKEFNKRWSNCKKWINLYFDIINSAKEPSKLNIKKDGIYYEAIQECISILSKIGSIKEIILFGSVARGEEKDGSDIDIAIKMFYSNKGFTKARQRNLICEIEEVLLNLQDKYTELLPNFKELNITSNIYEPKNPFHIINLTFQKKSNLKAYEKSGFFYSSISLLNRDSFDIIIEDEKFNIPYSKIDYVISDPRSYSSYGAIKIFEDKKNIALLYVPFDSTIKNIVFCQIFDKKICYHIYSKPDIYLVNKETLKKLLNNNFEKVNNFPKMPRTLDYISTGISLINNFTKVSETEDYLEILTSTYKNH